MCSTTSSSIITIDESFSTTSNDSFSTSNESCCENTHCVYCHDTKKIYIYHSALQPIKNQKTAQGLVYTCDLIKHNTSSTPTVVKTVVKMSKYVDFVLENEVEAWKRVSVFDSPHFVRVIKTVPLNKTERRPAVFFEEINTGTENGKYISGAQHLYNSQIDNTSYKNQAKCITLCDLLQNPDKHPSAVLNCVRQTLAAIIMYENVGITHYDLHTENIMIRNTPYDIHVYKLNDTIIPIMTFGIAPVIIDFGLAHIDNSNWAVTNEFLYQGLSTFVKDPIIDCVLLLTTVKTHMEFHNSWILSNYVPEMKVYYKYIKYVTGWFAQLHIDKNGWFTRNEFPDIVYDLLQSFPTMEYGLFSARNIGCVVELLQYSIIVPIAKLEKSDITFKQALLRLCVLWIETVEPVIKNIHREKLLFKNIVIYIAKHKNEVDVQDIIKLKKRHSDILNFRQLISSVCCLRNAYSNKIYKISMLTESIKTRLYATVAQKSTLDFLKDVPFVDYMVKPGMRVLVQDITEKKQHIFTINKAQTAKINNNPRGFHNIINDNICKQQSKI
jgi:hypothetical protein